MSEIYVDNQITDAVKERAYESSTVRILEMRVNPDTGELIFIGTDGLYQAMVAGIDVERYLAEKLAQMRRQFNIPKEA